MTGKYSDGNVGSDHMTFDELKPHLRKIISIISIGLIAFGSIYFVLSFIWDLSRTKNILGIILIVVLILTTYLVITPIPYDGQIVITTEETGKRVFSLELNRDPDDIERMATVTFKVVEENSPGFAE